MYPEKIKALEILNKYRNDYRIDYTTLRNETSLILDSDFNATIRELIDEGYLKDFKSVSEYYQYNLTLKGIHYKDILKEIKIERARVLRSEALSIISLIIAAISAIASIMLS